MKRIALLAALTLTASFIAYAAEPKEEVIAAAKKLGDQPNYSWKTTTSAPAGSQFRPGPMNGKADKDGTIFISMEFGDNLIEAFKKGDKGAITNQDGDWDSLADIENGEGPARFRAGMLRNLKAPSVQAADLASAAKELKKDGDAIAGELTADGAKQFLRFGRAEVKNASGSVKFWLKDGQVAKYEFSVKGVFSFNGEDREVDRATTVEISKVGETKVNIPEAAKKKLS